MQMAFSVHSNLPKSYQDVASKTQTIGESQRKIGFYRSTFENLNYGEALYGLNKLEPDNHTTWFAQSRGIVINLHDFHGTVELLGNNVRHNFAFIPSAIAANA